jgi:hypothetical protein
MTRRENLTDLPVEMVGSEWTGDFLNADEADGAEKTGSIVSVVRVNPSDPLNPRSKLPGYE